MRRLWRHFRARFEYYFPVWTYLSPTGAIESFTDPDDLHLAMQADQRDEAADQDMTDWDSFFWVINKVGMREVFAIARSEPDDDLALLLLAANTDFTIGPMDEEEA